MNSETLAGGITRRQEPSTHHRQARKLIQERRNVEALALLREAVLQQPQALEARLDLAVMLASQGDVDGAIAQFQQIVHVQPDLVDAWGNLGKLLLQRARVTEAVPALKRYVAGKPGQADGLIHLGYAYRAQGNLSDCQLCLEQAIALQPHSAEAHLQLGLAHARMGNPDDALTCYREALHLDPNLADAHHHLGAFLRSQGHLDDATHHLKQAIKLRPGSPITFVQLGIAYAEQRDFKQAQTCYQEALRLQPHSHEAHNNLGNVFLQEGKLPEAATCFQKAIQIKPDYAEAHSNLGIVLGKQGDLKQAIALFDQALRWKPNQPAVHVNLALHCLAAGEFERGWREYEWRWRLGTTPLRSFSQPAWDGSPLNGRTILIYAEQGLGDTLQFLRYAELIKKRGGRTAVEVPPQLMKIVATCPGIDVLIPQGAPLPAFDVHAAILSLPRLCKTSLENIPCSVPYLNADAQLVDLWRRELASLEGVKIGIAWQGSPKYVDDAVRSIPLQHFAALASIDKVRLIALQKGPGEGQAADCSFPLTKLPPRDEAAGGFMDTAAILKQIDLLITSDSAIAHIAGALGVPVWVALPAVPDWRWLRERDDTPWYPTMRLFRQARLGDWDELFQRIADELRRRLDPAAPRQERLGQAYDRAMQLVAQRNFGEAITWFRQALEQHPEAFDVWHNLGVAQVQQGLRDDALVSLRKALTIRPEAAEAYSNCGLVLLQKGNSAEAITNFRQAIARKPAAPEFHNNLATAQIQHKQVDDAIRSYQKALELRPDMADTHRNLGYAFRLKKRFPEARASYERALSLNPDAIDLHHDIGLTFLQEDRHEEAAAHFRQVVEQKPKNVDSWNNLAVALADLGHLDEAIRTMEQALEHLPGHPETHRNLALLRLMNGDWKQGFREFEWRWQCAKSGKRNLSRPQWDGEPLAGKTILLHAEQGLGDTLQLIRYARMVQERGGKVIVECQKPLVSLITRSGAFDQLVARGDPLPEFDVHAPLMSLPGLFGTMPNNVPAKVPYLQANPELIDAWRGRLRGWAGLKVGVGWQGNPKYGGDRHRSIPFAHFASLADVPGVQFISLQKGHGTEQIAKTAHRMPLLDLDRLIDNPLGSFEDTAAVMVNLDLIITSDTALAHLAGGLGVPVWVPLNRNCDWRWLRQGESTGWYPTMRLFRQTQLGEWDTVFAGVRSELERFVVRQLGGADIFVPCAPGELLDKLTILQIKRERVTDPQKLHNVQIELEELTRVRQIQLPTSDRLTELETDLRRINEMLWQIEDDIRECERLQDFGLRFVELARSVYLQNDRRATVKRRINELLGSRLFEVKSYAPYGSSA